MLTTRSWPESEEELEYVPSGRRNTIEAPKHGMALYSLVLRAQETMTLGNRDESAAIQREPVAA